jgi:hypothetical protein
MIAHRQIRSRLSEPIARFALAMALVHASCLD